MPDAYATPADLTAWLPDGTVVAEPERLLSRASELIDGHVLATYTVDDGTGLPTDTDIAAALRDATCAQVEFWLEVGEEHDVANMAGRRVSIGHLSIDDLPGEFAARARRLLANAGLLSPGAIGGGGQVCCW